MEHERRIFGAGETKDNDNESVETSEDKILKIT